MYNTDKNIWIKENEEIDARIKRIEETYKNILTGILSLAAFSTLALIYFRDSLL